MVPRFMPRAAQALKWLSTVIVPLDVGDWRMEMYWLKVEVLWMEG
jgi:hypothetical protein